MPLLELAQMTWTEVDALPRDGVVALLPVGAVEAHGPHLPLVTDGVIARAMTEAGGRRLADVGWTALLLPGVDYTAAPFASAFPGTFSVRPETVTALVVDVARAAARHGIRALVIANAHLDPAHVGSLRAAVEEIVAERILTPVFPDVTRKPWALRLTDEFKSGACHAGQYEGSIVMAARPELVREEAQRDLPANPSSLSVAIRDGVSSFAEAGGPMAYFGDPAAASRSEGEETIEVLGEIVADAVAEALGEPPPGGAL